MRTREDAFGARSGVGAVGGAATLIVELLPGYPTLPESAPLTSYRYGKQVKVSEVAEALGALGRVVAEAGDDSSEVGLRSLRIGETPTLVAGGEGPQRATQRGR